MLSLLCLVPFAGALISAVMPARPKLWAFAFALITLVIGIVAAFVHPAEDAVWMKPLGVHWALDLDGLSTLMVLLTVALVPLVMIAAVKDHDRRWYAWALALEAFALVVFCAADVFVFYVAFEATLIPAYFMIGQNGGPKRARAALKFLMFQLGGGLVLLGAVIGLFVVSQQQGAPSYLISDLAKLHMSTTAERWIFIAMFIAFAVKAPLFPVHTWLADTTEQATPPTSVLLVCVLDKIGTFGMIRLCLTIVPGASHWATPVVMVLALISIVYGAVLAIGQDDLLRLIGLTSLSHFGLITLGIFAGTAQGLSGAILYMVNHGVATAAMFLVAGFLIARRGTASISQLKGLEKGAPVMAGLFLVAGLATAGLPGLSQFVSEILVLISGFDYHWLVGVIAVTAIVLAAIYVLWAYQRIFTGPPAQRPVRDLDRRELSVLVPLVAALLVFGFAPGPLLDAANPVTDHFIQHDHPDVAKGQ
ncbi:MAG: NADH-quinone oxidoreductase subunit M [Nocardioides sp.]|nr:NADH-quinone oxidoreductase subunit M [Nocardioides sp.]